MIAACRLHDTRAGCGMCIAFRASNRGRPSRGSSANPTPASSHLPGGQKNGVRNLWSGPPRLVRPQTAPGARSRLRRPAHLVPVKKSIRPAATEFGRRGMLAARVGPEPSSLTTRSCDDPRPRCLGLRPRPPRQLNRCRAGECRPPSSTGGAATISWPAPAPLPGPALLGWALTAVGRVAGHPPHCPTRDRPRLAPGRLPALLALEVPAPLSGSPAARS